jgi:putative membrane protein
LFIIRGISGWKLREGLLLVFGILLGAVICTLSPTQTPDGLWFIFLSGALAICAMILPGISGSFILLILGKYEYVLGAISGLVAGVDPGRNLLILGVFGLGAIIGILAFSRFLHWLLARWQKETMIVLAGFIIGSLVKIWPWSNAEAIVLSQFPELASFGDALPTEIISQYMASADLHIGGAVLFAVIGFSLVTGIEMASKVASRKKTA